MLTCLSGIIGAVVTLATRYFIGYIAAKTGCFRVLESFGIDRDVFH